MIMVEPTLLEEGGVRVVKLYETNREVELVPSLEAAIEAVEGSRTSRAICEEIVTRDGEVIYNSDRNSSIEEWKSAWLPEAKRV